MIAIETHNLSAGYTTPIISGLNLSVNAGDYLCITGPNGSGKSTLMKTLLGLIPPLSGSVKIHAGAGDVGYVPQQNDLQKDFPASVSEVVMSGFQGRLGLRPFYSQHEKESAESAMMRMNIAELSRKSYRELSGGQRQRVLISRALCAGRKIMFLDEPVAGLDSQSAKEMYRVIHELNTEGMTVIMISHDTESSMKYATRVLTLGRA